MAQDPWKRAQQIKSLRDRQTSGQTAAAGKHGESPRLRRRRGPAIAAWLMLCILLLGAGASWYFRSSWLPSLKRQVQEEAPELQKIAEAIPEERVVLNATALDAGLGFGLKVEADYLELLAAMREQDPGWMVTATGGASARLTAPGAVVKVVDGRILNYELQLEQLFAAEGWKPWLKAFEDARLTPLLTWTSITGEQEMPKGLTEHELAGRVVKRSDGWITPVYILRFSDGFLRSIELAIRFGVADESIQPRDAPPPSQPGG